MYILGRVNRLLFMKSLKELEEEYKKKQRLWKMSIRLDTNKFRRFWKWVWYFVAFPFVWLFYNMRDWRSVICVIISFLLWSSSVWVWYLLAIFTGWTSTTIGKWFLGIGSAIWVWWISPVGSPFILLVSLTSIGIKALFNKIEDFKDKRKKKREMEQKCPYIVEKEK